MNLSMYVALFSQYIFNSFSDNRKNKEKESNFSNQQEVIAENKVREEKKVDMFYIPGIEEEEGNNFG